MHTPPTESIRSIIATRLRSFPPSSAAFCPAGPDPITTKSYTACDINLNDRIDRNAQAVYDKPPPPACRLAGILSAFRNTLSRPVKCHSKDLIPIRHPQRTRDETSD